MHLYRGTADSLSRDLSNGSFVPRLKQRFFDRMLHEPTVSEVHSWENSLPAAVSELIAAGLNDAEILVEYFLPLTSKRADLLIIGTHPDTELPSVIVWENKQWTVGDISDVEQRIVSVLGRLNLHPQQQVKQYVEYLTDFNHLAHDGSLIINGLAFLHNATSDEISRLRSSTLTDLASYPMFSGDQTGALREFLKSNISGKNSANAADDFILARTKPSKQLLDHVREQIEGNDSFTLLDEQLIAYDVVRQSIEESRRSNKKTVIIVKGGPGTGKSVIATAVISDLAKRGYNVSHATGSRSFTTTLRNKVGTRAGNLFRYFNSFMSAQINDLDVLVADEAHRIRTTSNNRFTKRELRTDVRQIDELILAARVPMFLLDEQQTVRPGEIGTVQQIKEAAINLDAQIIEIDLNGQFRSGGSEAYLHWVQSLLGLIGDGPIRWEPDERFNLYICDNPEDMEQWTLKMASQGHSSRMTAGFCWQWSDPVGETLLDDVVIGKWSKPWNLKPEKRVKDIPSASLWASDPKGIGQIGCIYTAQGFEYDYGAVIIGQDMVWRNGSWQTNSSASADGIVKRSDNFDELVRHTYRVLLTRGLKGCLIYSVDEQTREFIRTLGLENVS